MAVTLDLYTKQSKAYYCGLSIAVVTMLYCAIMALFFPNTPSMYPKPNSALDHVYDTSLVICVLISFIFFFIAGLGTLPTYVKDGELELAEDYLVIDNTKMTIADINKINLEVAERTFKSWRLSRNRIEIIAKNGNTCNRRFSVSRDESVEFDKVLDQWRSTRVPFAMRYNRI